jgi:RNA polymerase sigma factor (sigma-70 family)
MAIKVLIVDDLKMIREGLKILLESDEQIKIIGEAENGLQALQQVEALAPDLVLMDVRMPEMDGITATQIILNRFPKVKVLILTTFDDSEYIERIFDFKKVGYVLKDTDYQKIIQIIHLANQGFTQFSPDILQNLNHSSTSLSQSIKNLTSKEKEVLSSILNNNSNQEISEILNISQKTVKNHITSIFSKLQVNSRLQIMKNASDYSKLLS